MKRYIDYFLNKFDKNKANQISHNIAQIKYYHKMLWK